MLLILSNIVVQNLLGCKIIVMNYFIAKFRIILEIKSTRKDVEPARLTQFFVYTIIA